ncbi:MAG TPA: hypothetical protein DCF68_22980 [Cyanothece sp. UBA12306]|nr:hypothetical protein [Cyanothece sp. UBA12306]
MNQELSNVTRFSKDWWLLYQEIWNDQQEFKHKLKGLGKVVFLLQNELKTAVCLDWDDQGNIVEVEMLENIDDGLPIFSAKEENWDKFLNKEIGAAKAVMSGLIDYQGSFSTIVKYGKGFDYLADVAQKMS